MPNEFPNLSEDFFSVCQTAIKSAAWKYEDFSRVKGVEGELDLLRAFCLSQPATTPIEFEAVSDTISTTAPFATKDTSQEITPHLEPPVASKPVTEIPTGLVTPEEAKKIPARPMPQEILDLVQVGIDVAKNPPKVREAKVIELSSDPDAARQAWSQPF